MSLGIDADSTFGPDVDVSEAIVLSKLTCCMSYLIYMPALNLCFSTLHAVLLEHA